MNHDKTIRATKSRSLTVLLLPALLNCGLLFAGTGALTANAADLPTTNWQDIENIANGFDAASGDGSTAEMAYIITTPRQLAYLAKQVNSGTIYSGEFITLNGNLDLSAHLWTPIGTYVTGSYAFLGTFDGGGKVITGLTTNTTADYQGLFGYIRTEGTVKNLGLEGGSVKGGTRVGGVIGFNYDGTVTNCYNTGEINGSGDATGGVFGYNTSTVTNCYNTGAVNGSGNFIGGVVGYNTSTVTDCYNSGAVNGSGNYTGGVVGWNAHERTITNCYNTGVVSGAAGTSVGGVVGGHDFGAISNCYYDVTVINAFIPEAGYSKPGSAVGSGISVSTVKGLTTEQMTGEDALTNMALDDTVWVATAGYPQLAVFAGNSRELSELIALMNAIETCKDYDQAAQLRRLYNALSEDEKIIFDNTVCAEDENCLMSEKLAYMESLAASVGQTTNTNLQTNLIDGARTNLVAILIIGMVGLSAIVGYYFILKRKYRVE